MVFNVAQARRLYYQGYILPTRTVVHYFDDVLLFVLV